MADEKMCLWQWWNKIEVVMEQPYPLCALSCSSVTTLCLKCVMISELVQWYWISTSSKLYREKIRNLQYAVVLLNGPCAYFFPFHGYYYSAHFSPYTQIRSGFFKLTCKLENVCTIISSQIWFKTIIREINREPFFYSIIYDE